MEWRDQGASLAVAASSLLPPQRVQVSYVTGWLSVFFLQFLSVLWCFEVVFSFFGRFLVFFSAFCVCFLNFLGHFLVCVFCIFCVFRNSQQFSNVFWDIMSCQFARSTGLCCPLVPYSGLRDFYHKSSQTTKTATFEK